ncbi:MAG: GWxTD domain-containing protein [Acidobacteria bacterium]|nr:GWxTD domain-containing protein [Acidobacteriota bacterium]
MRSLSFLLTLPLFVTLSAGLQDWGRGPVQWIMSKDEQRAWSQVKTDQQANDFIDLFWARRDPTPGTERNEYKEGFDQRVRAVDKAFSVGRKRGALTDKGRVWIVLGVPKDSSGYAGGMNTDVPAEVANPSFADSRAERQASGPNLRVVSRTMGRDSFTYKNYSAVGLTGPEVVFIQDGYTHEYKLDPQQGNAYGALSAMAAKSIVNPDLTSTPDWALKGGLTPQPKQVKMTVDSTKLVERPKVEIPMLTGEPGATRLTLLKDVHALQLQGTSDPFAGLASAAEFVKSDELGYAFRLCRPTAFDDNVKVTMRITGDVGGKTVNMAAPVEEMTPEAIRVMPGCYAVRAAIPLDGFAAGNYRLALHVEDGGREFDLTQELKIQ